MSNRCLYYSSFEEFVKTDPLKVLGAIHDEFHGEALTTTNDAWKDEIEVLIKEEEKMILGMIRKRRAAGGL